MHELFLCQPVLSCFTFKDVTNPTANCPDNQVADAQDEGNTTTTVDFPVSCEDTIDKNIGPNCNATENVTPFPVGETTVSCSCTDQSNNTDLCSFKVTVNGMYESSSKE